MDVHNSLIDLFDQTNTKWQHHEGPLDLTANTQLERVVLWHCIPDVQLPHACEL